MSYNPPPLDHADDGADRGALFVRNTRLSPRRPWVTADDLLGSLLVGAIGAIVGLFAHMVISPWMDLPWDQSGSVGRGALYAVALYLLGLGWAALGTRHVRALERAIDQGLCVRATAAALEEAIAGDSTILSGTGVATATRTRFRAAWGATPDGLVLHSLLQVLDDGSHTCRIVQPPNATPADADGTRHAPRPVPGWTLPLRSVAPSADPHRWAMEHHRVQGLFFDTPYLDHGTSHARLALHARIRAQADGTAALWGRAPRHRASPNVRSTHTPPA